jgi:hypothetical protein
MKKLFLVLVWVCAAVVARAETPDLFGLTLGKPLNLPDCAINEETQHLYEALANVPTLCMQRHLRDNTALGSMPTEMVGIAFPPAEKPLPYTDALMMGSLNQQGELVHLLVFTEATAQEQILQQLTTRFGKPQSLNRVALSSGPNAASGAIEAKWELEPGIGVLFNGDDGASKAGFIVIWLKSIPGFDPAAPV